MQTGSSRGHMASAMGKAACCCACLLLLALLHGCTALEALKAAAISREIRQHFRSSGMNWVSPKFMREVVDLSTNTKPIMYLFTLQSCAFCRQLMEEFSKGSDLDHLRLSQLSAQFHAVLVLDDYNLEYGAEYTPKGFAEVPRIIFADPNGKVRPDFTNPKSDESSAWFYSSVEEVVAQMRTVLKYYQEQPLSLARQAVQFPGSEDAVPAASVASEGGARRYPGGLERDLPS